MTPIILGVSGLIIALLVCVISERRKRRAFEARFPPISDAEFIERCAPGTSPDVALKARRILSNSLGVDCERIHPSSRFVEDLGAD
jgi:hypothetical protein